MKKHQESIEYVVAKSPKYGFYCVSREHLRKYQKFVPIGKFNSFKKAQYYLYKNKKSISKKYKNAETNYLEPTFTTREIKQKVKTRTNYSYNKQNGPVIITKPAKNQKTNDFSLFEFNKYQNSVAHRKQEILKSPFIIKDFILIKIYKDSKNNFCSKSVKKSFKSSSEDLLYSNLLKYCSKYNITIYSEILY